MNTELLREDEKEPINRDWPDTYASMLRQRLIDEREESNHNLDMLTDARLEIVKLLAELNEALDLVYDAYHFPGIGECWMADASDLLGRHNR